MEPGETKPADTEEKPEEKTDTKVEDTDKAEEAPDKISATFPGDYLKVVLHWSDGTSVIRLLCKSTCDLCSWKGVRSDLLRLWISEPKNLLQPEPSLEDFDMFFTDDDDRMDVKDLNSYDDFVLLCCDKEKMPKIELRLKTESLVIEEEDDAPRWRLQDVPTELLSETRRKRAWSVGSSSSLQAAVTDLQAVQDGESKDHGGVPPIKRAKKEHVVTKHSGLDSHEPTSASTTSSYTSMPLPTPAVAQNRPSRAQLSHFQVYVSGLPQNATEGDVRRIFHRFDDNIVAVYKKERFAFVHMNGMTSATNAINELNGTLCLGKKVRLEQSYDSKNYCEAHTPTHSSRDRYAGGGSGGGSSGGGGGGAREIHHGSGGGGGGHHRSSGYSGGGGMRTERGRYHDRFGH